MSRFLFVLMAVLLFSFEVSSARTLYVAKTGDGSTGSDWPGAYPTINEALTLSASGDQIWVASGTYHEHIPLATGVALYGGFAGTEATDEIHLRDPLKKLCTVEWTGQTNPVFSGASNSVVDGFLFTSLNKSRGGSIFDVHMEIRNSIIKDNLAHGLYIFSSTVRLTNCQITDNETSGAGAGAEIQSSSVTFDSCVISDNFAKGSAGGISTIFTNLTMVNCLISENESDRIGGGLHMLTDDRVVLKHCTIVGNKAQFYDEELQELVGDGIYQGRPTGIATDSRVDLINCILWDDWGPKTASAAEYHFVNCDVTRLNKLSGPVNTSIDSFDLDPELVDPEGGNYHLQSHSPCIDSGTLTNLHMDLDGNPRPIDVAGRGNSSAFDMGCYEFQLRKSDMNRDGKVDAEDLLMFQEEWMEEETR